MDIFEAGVQYNDYLGTAAADKSDNNSLRAYLVAQGVADEGDQVIGFRIHSGENHGPPVTEVSVVAYLVRSDVYNPAPKIARAVEVTVTPGQAFAFFKRFDLVAIWKGLDVSKTQVEGPFYG